MKKLTFLLLALSVSYNTMSQGLGVRGGYSLTNWKGYVLADADFESNTLNAFHLGIYMGVELSESIILEPGLFYSRKGAGGTTEIPGERFLAENKSAYLDVPLLLRFYFGGFNFSGGPQLSLLMSNEMEVTVTDTSTNQSSSSTEDTADQFNDTDLAFCLGMGYEFDNGFNINLTYDIGLSNVLIDEDALSSLGIPGQYYSWIEANNRVIKLSLGITF